MKKSLILIVVPALFFLGCKPKPSPTPGTTTPPQPKACFNINKTLIDSGETITTTNCSTHASSYYWNFGLGLQSSSSATSPSFTYKDSGTFKPVRGTAYKIELTAFGPGTLQDIKDTYVTVGERRIDSVVVSNVPSYPFNGTSIQVQFGPGSHPSQYTSPAKVPASWPCTFNLKSDSIIIGKTNNMSWGGIIFNSATSHTYTAFGPPIGPAIYLSRGVNVSPIIVKDHSTPPFELDFYYHVVP